MAGIKFDVNKGFKEVFGVYTQVPLFIVPKNLENNQTETFPDAQAAYQNDTFQRGPALIAPTGVPMWDRFSVEIPLENESGIQSFFLPHSTVASVYRSKNIVKTVLQGKENTVKEFISKGDHEITLRGFCINYDEDSYPEDEVRLINQLFEIDKAIVINSKYLSLFGIKNVVVEDMNWPPMEGYQNCAAFEIKIISDSIIELEVGNA